jgi:CYTH domain-containing protein
MGHPFEACGISFMGLESPNTSKHPTASGHSLDIKGPAIDRKTELNGLSEGREIEAKFFIPPEVARKLIKGRSFSQIEQHYFKERDIAPLLHALLQGKRISEASASPAAINRKVFAPEEFSSARIRRTRHPGERPDYHLEFKGSKVEEENVRISRREASYTITSAEYKSLKEMAIAGAIRKRRYSIPGTIQVKNEVLHVTAQIDCLQAAGKKLKAVVAAFNTVDIELHNAAHIHALRSGRHSFSFLPNCVELSALDRKLVKPLTTRRIAKTGLEEDAIDALRKLEAVVQQMSTRGKN